ncbi:MAG: hypothetical protein F4X93_06150 [Proteobacteria bacterium]|nr:hypothetical protein [Pseudomonadota bacterium]
MIEIVGLAARTGVWYPMWDHYGPYEERVAPGAFEDLDGPMVLRFDHTGLPLASMGPGRANTLTVWQDEEGLWYRAYIDDSPAGNNLLRAVQRRDAIESSFYGRMVEWEWDKDMAKLTLTRVSMARGDVAPVTYGANPYTSVEIPGNGTPTARTSGRRMLARMVVSPKEVTL